MNKNEMNPYYESLIREKSTPSTQVGWRDTLAQKRRFQQFCRLIDGEINFDIADLGCGLAGLYDYLCEGGYSFKYTGYDISPDMIKYAANTISSGDNECELALIGDSEEMGNHDFIVASGIFNIRGKTSNDSWLSYILGQLDVIDNRSKKGFAFNLLTSFSDEEYKRVELYYAEPCRLFDHCKKNFSRNVALLHDYDEYDFTIIVRK